MYSKCVKITFAVILLLTIVQATNCYNILFIFSFGSTGHRHAIEPLAKELVKRGHQVTLFSSSNATKEERGITNVFHSDGVDLFADSKESFEMESKNIFARVVEAFNLVRDLGHSFYKHPFITDLVSEPIYPKTNKPKFDIVVVDTIYNDFALPIAHHLGVPNILFSPTIIFVTQTWFMDIPVPISYVPIGVLDVKEQMNYVERAKNLFSFASYMALFKRYYFPQLDEVVHEVFPKSPSITDLIKNVSFIITNTHFSTNVISPTMPYFVEVGGIHCHPAKPFPKDLEEFMQSSKDDGVIYFSLGSFTQSDSMPREMKDKIIEAFSRLPQKILWKYEKELDNLPKNVKLIKWAPQQDLLAHPKLRLFISHGGGLSIGEAAYHGCPILGFPLRAEQMGNVVQARNKGFGEFLDWKTFTSQQLFDLITKMIKNHNYRSSAQLASVLLKDRPQPPVETAAYWIEYVTRHNGAQFLKSQAKNLNIFQYFLIDIFAAFLGVLAIIALLCCLVCKCIFRKFGCCKNDCGFLNFFNGFCFNTKSKTNKKITNKKKIKQKTN